MFVYQKSKRFLCEEEGATAVEYAIMLAVIALAVTQAIMALGTTSKTVFETVAGALP